MEKVWGSLVRNIYLKNGQNNFLWKFLLSIITVHFFQIFHLRRWKIRRENTFFPTLEAHIWRDLDKSKMHLKTLFLLGLSFGLLAVGVNLDDNYHETSGDLNETFVEEENRSSHDSTLSLSNDDAYPITVIINSSTLSTPPKPVINSPQEIIISAFVPAIQDYQKNTTKDSPSSSLILPNTSEPNTTVKDISSPRFAVHESSTEVSSKDSNASLVISVVGDRITELESSNKELINSSLEMTTPLNEFHSSDNFTKVKSNTTLKNSGLLEDIETYKTKELPMVVTTSKSQTEKNLDLSLSKRQNKSASIGNHPEGSNFIPNSITTASLSTSSSDTATSSIVSEIPDLSMNTLLNQNINISTSENVASNNTNFEFKTKDAPELTFTTLANHEILYENSSKLEDSDIILIENRTALLQEDDEYTVTVPKSCSNHSTISRLLHLLNTAPNSKGTTNFECETLKNTKIMIKSKTLMDKVNEFLKAEGETDEMVSIKVQPNSTISFDVIPQCSYDGGIFISYVTIAIFGGIMIAIIIFLCFLLCYQSKCRRYSTSVDLHHIPRLNLKSDYTLTPIPRPSISFPDGNRDFLHAYAQNSHNRSRQDNNTLHQRHSSDNMAKTYEEIDKEIGSKQEMQTFTMSSSRKSDLRASASQDYASYHTSSWDRLHENNYSRKHGVDNPGYRKW